MNGNPNQSSSNPLAFQFSFDQQNILEMNLIFFVVYLVLVPMQIYAVRIQKHPVTKLFTLSLILEFVSLVFILSYYIRYAASGVGNEAIKTTGDILDILSRVCYSNFFALICHTPIKNSSIFSVLPLRIADHIYVDTVVIGQRMGCHPTASHKIGMDFTHVHMDTVLCIPCGSIRMESSEYFRRVYSFLVQKTVLIICRARS